MVTHPWQCQFIDALVFTDHGATVLSMLGCKPWVSLRKPQECSYILYLFVVELGKAHDLRMQHLLEVY